MRINDLHTEDEEAILQVADILVRCFPRSWPNREAGVEEVKESFGEGRISRVAVDREGEVIGWIGGIREYDGHAWELHPLVVRPDRQRRGVGAALVADLEERVREQGACTLYLGTDDERDQTSLSGVDLYHNLFERLASIQNLRGHPYEFYLKQDFVIVGALPDANGPGKPDILMAKRLR